MSFESSPPSLMSESSTTPGSPSEPEEEAAGGESPLIDAPIWARLLLVLTPFLVGGLVILLLRAFAG